MSIQARWFSSNKREGFKAFLSLLAIICFIQPSFAQHRSPRLEIERLTQNTYVHRSFLQTSDWGKVACNGLIYINRGEALIFDSPADEDASAELLSWIQDEMHAKVKGVVINHFHDDCLGGLEVFHKAAIKSYSSRLTLELAKATDVPVSRLPQNVFDKQLTLQIGGEKVLNRFFGEAHTRDNIASYIPAERVIFGGCMVKEVGAKKGNLADANVSEWTNTVKKLMKSWNDAKFVVPGHGEAGDLSLLEYTATLFKK